MSPRDAKPRSGKAAASRSDQARAGAGGRAGAVRAVRCAIYTRKSSEEGLEQDFNSLHAQREACEAYVASQRHEGWTVLPEVYDDGGFSGGSLSPLSEVRMSPLTWFERRGIDARRGFGDERVGARACVVGAPVC